MSIESGWVPWNERNFLPERFALIRIYPCKDGYYERDVTIGNFIFLLPTRTIPDERIEQVKKEVLIILNLYPRKLSVYTPSGVLNIDIRYIIEFPTISELSRNDGVFAMKLKSEGDKRSLSMYTEPINQALVKVESIDRYEFEVTAQKQITDVPAVPAVSDSPAVLFVPEFDNSNDWIKTSEMAQEMVNNGISIDIEAAEKHLRNMKSNGRKSAEKYDEKNSMYGEINISSFQVKWRMVKKGGKWSVYFYRPSLKWKQK